MFTIRGDGRALLASIRANPDDDLPRLVFADWLDDHGVPDWAELIRVQVRAAHVTDPDKSLLLTRHANRLARTHRDWDQAFGPGLQGHAFARGMPERLRVRGTPTPDHRRLLERYPVRELWLSSESPDHPQRIAHRSWFDALLADLSGGPVLDLSVAGYGLRDADVAAVAGLTQLRRLTLWCRQLQPGSFAHLRRLPHLRHLALIGGGVRTDDLTHVAAVPGLEGLELCDCPLSAPSFRRLIAAPGLRSLAVRGHFDLELTEADVRSLMESPLDASHKIEFLSRAGRFDLVLELARGDPAAAPRGTRQHVRAGSR